jgi:hypothetical protein
MNSEQVPRRAERQKEDSFVFFKAGNCFLPLADLFSSWRSLFSQANESITLRAVTLAWISSGKEILDSKEADDSNTFLPQPSRGENQRWIVKVFAGSYMWPSRKELKGCIVSQARQVPKVLAAVC